MATRQARAAIYGDVVVALVDAARIDGHMERVAIAKAMDALGSTISDTSPTVVAQAIAFRNGPLLRDHQPVDTYLRRDPVPVKWSFEWTEVMGWKWSSDISLEGELIQEAHTRAKVGGYLAGFTDEWYGEVDEGIDDGYFTVTLYPDDSVRLETVEGVERKPANRTPPGQLPTILIKFEWALGLLDVQATMEFTIIKAARKILRECNPGAYAKLTDNWWGKVGVTDIGYLVTFHYDRELP